MEEQDILNLNLDDLQPTPQDKKTVKVVAGEGRYEVKRHGVTVDMVDSEQDVKRGGYSGDGYAIYRHDGDSKRLTTPYRAPKVPGNRPHHSSIRNSRKVT